MKKTLLCFLVLIFCANVGFAYSASSLKREINYIQSDIKQAQRKISTIKHSNRLSEYDKKRQIRKLEYKIYQKKRELRKIKYDYQKALSYKT